MHLKVYMLAILSCLIIKVFSQQYQLPPVIASSDKYIRLNEIQELHEPDIQLQKIYRRQVYKVSSVPSDSKSSMLGQFGPCKETPPEVSFKNIGYYHLDQPLNSYSQSQQVTNSTEAPRKSSNIIYDYEVLKGKYQNIVDMLYWDETIYTISSTGLISVYRLSNDDNGIQLKSTVKGVDWEGLYQYRYQSWMTAEKNEKERLEKIQEIENKKMQEIENKKMQEIENKKIQEIENKKKEKNNSTIVNNKTQAQQKNINQNNSTLNTTTLNTTTLNTTTNTTANSTRTLQEINPNPPSPKVRTNKDITSNTTQSNESKQNQTQPPFYTVPTPQKPKAHLQKGYFQFMDNNQLLIFANNQYLIAYDITRNQSILLSEQLKFDDLFPLKNTTVQPKKNITNNKTNTTNSTTNSTTNPIKNTTTNSITNSTTNTTSNQTSNKTSNTTSNFTTNSTIDTNQTIPVDNKTSTISNQTSTNSNQTTAISNQTTTQPSPQKDNSTSEKIEEPQQPYPEPVPAIPAQYIMLSQFQQITKINQTHFVLADRKQGIFIYQITKRKPNNYTYTSNPSNYAIRKTAFIGKEQFGKSYQQNQQMNLVDIEFYHNKSLLLVLDYEKGVFAFQQPIIKTQKNNSISQIEEKLPPFVLSSYTIIKKMCNLMEFSETSQTLYLSCNKIYRISLANWPKITEKTFPHPLINIRQIFVEEERDIFILSGYSVFKVMYLDRTTNYFQDDMLDKIIFNKDFAITANENHIIALKYKVEKPAIYCETRNNSLVGTHNLLLRTTAQCSQSYLKSINYTKAQNQSFNENDICVYTVYKNVYIWEQGEVPLKPLAIVMLVFLIFIVVMIIWYVLIKLRMQRVNQRIKYLSEQGHKTLVEEQQPKQSQTQENSSQNNDTAKDPQADKKNVQQANSSELDHNKDLYSIQ